MAEKDPKTVSDEDVLNILGFEDDSDADLPLVRRSSPRSAPPDDSDDSESHSASAPPPPPPPTAPPVAHPGFAYKMIQIPKSIVESDGKDRAGSAAAYLQRMANGEMEGGWEFYRVDAVGDQFVVTFRRAK